MTDPAPFLPEADLRRLIEAFRASGATALDLRFGATRLCLGRAIAPLAEVPGQAVTAPRVGLFTARVAAGDSVAEGAVVGMVKSLQAERPVLAPCAGRIGAVLVGEGVFVGYGEPLLTIVALEGGGA